MASISTTRAKSTTMIRNLETLFGEGSGHTQFFNFQSKLEQLGMAIEIVDNDIEQSAALKLLEHRNRDIDLTCEFSAVGWGDDDSDLTVYHENVRLLRCDSSKWAYAEREESLIPYAFKITMGDKSFRVTAGKLASCLQNSAKGPALGKDVKYRKFVHDLLKSESLIKESEGKRYHYRKYLNAMYVHNMKLDAIALIEEGVDVLAITNEGIFVVDKGEKLPKWTMRYMSLNNVGTMVSVGKGGGVVMVSSGTPCDRLGYSEMKYLKYLFKSKLEQLI